MTLITQLKTVRYVRPSPETHALLDSAHGIYFRLTNHLRQKQPELRNHMVYVRVSVSCFAKLRDSFVIDFPRAFETLT